MTTTPLFYVEDHGGPLAGQQQYPNVQHEKDGFPKDDKKDKTGQELGQRRGRQLWAGQREAMAFQAEESGGVGEGAVGRQLGTQSKAAG